MWQSEPLLLDLRLLHIQGEIIGSSVRGTRFYARERGGDLLHSRRYLLVALAIVTPLGFGTKLYQGPWAGWVNDYAGGVFYEIFWILAILALRPSLRARNVGAAVFVATCALEVLQRWKPPLLQALRSTFLGQALLGTTFVWWDFPYYALGCLIGVLVAQAADGSAASGGGSQP